MLVAPGLNMSVQFGRWNFDGKPVDRCYLERVGAVLAPYGPDGGSSYGDKNISILYYAFHTTNESRGEVQPHMSASGAVIIWDGRLDNRADLVREFADAVSANSMDVAILAAAYEKWGTNCFSKLIGDWAVSIWNPVEHSLLLAKDPVGTRHLYYAFDRNQIMWSTVLDPLVRFAGRTFELNEEYIAGWLSMFPATHLTPWVGIHSVPPSSFVLVRPGQHATSRYWDFDPNNKIRYRTDAEYEEHFRTVFARAVQRRLRSDSPVLAELSGGRDSSSIVCMADEIIARGEGECPRLDTISYYDDAEPNWNERLYFAKVEQKRGRVGWHVNVGDQAPQQKPGPHDFAASNHGSLGAPADDGRSSPQFAACVASQGNRVVLSGIGGDEIMGGVPTALPELANLLAKARLRALAHQLKVWALENRRPWFHLFWDAMRGFLPPSLVGVPNYLRPAAWLQGNFVKHHWAALIGYPSRTKLFGALPSFQDAAITLHALRRQLACTALPLEPPFEKRYPYLDRGLLEFMFGIPREQLIRPTQRRSLMRRALTGIVPDEILNRKTKAFVSRSPLVEISKDWTRLVQMTQNMLSSSLGIVDSELFYGTLQKAKAGEVVSVVALLRTIQIEDWLRSLRRSGSVTTDTSAGRELSSSSPKIGFTR